MRERAHAHAYEVGEGLRERERESQADSALSVEPCVGLHLLAHERNPRFPAIQVPPFFTESFETLPFGALAARGVSSIGFRVAVWRGKGNAQ